MVLRNLLNYGWVVYIALKYTPSSKCGRKSEYLCEIYVNDYDDFKSLKN